MTHHIPTARPLATWLALLLLALCAQAATLVGRVMDPPGPGPARGTPEGQRRPEGAHPGGL